MIQAGCSKKCPSFYYNDFCIDSTKVLSNAVFASNEDTLILQIRDTLAFASVRCKESFVTACNCANGFLVEYNFNGKTIEVDYLRTLDIVKLPLQNIDSSCFGRDTFVMHSSVYRCTYMNGLLSVIEEKGTKWIRK